MPVRGDFIPGPSGALAVVSFRPPGDAAPAFAVLHLPAFAEEMNKSRRMVAQQAREFVSMGGAACVLDLRGTGDSAGESGDATWQGWLDDAATAWTWMRAEVGPHVPLLLWGSRLGALLVVEAVRSGALAPAAILLWQPVAEGRRLVDGFLRAARLATGNGHDEGPSQATLRACLERGQPVEVAGYELAPELVRGIDAAGVAPERAPGCPVIWREVVAVGPPEPAPWARAAADAWSANGRGADLAAVAGPSFWASAEIEEAPALIASTSDAVRQLLGAGANAR